jgi:hypothetical protein
MKEQPVRCDEHGNAVIDCARCGDAVRLLEATRMKFPEGRVRVKHDKTRFIWRADVGVIPVVTRDEFSVTKWRTGLCCSTCSAMLDAVDRSDRKDAPVDKRHWSE